MTVALVAAVLVGVCVSGVAASVVGLKCFGLWLAFRREGQKHDSTALAEALKRIGELEQKMTAAELAKLRR